MFTNFRYYKNYGKTIWKKHLKLRKKITKYYSIIIIYIIIMCKIQMQRKNAKIKSTLYILVVNKRYEKY